jgi:hypothetical protein
MRTEMIRLAKQHTLLAVANHSADTSFAHSATVYNSDCSDKPQTIADDYAGLTADLTRWAATDVHITSATLDGYPAPQRESKPWRWIAQCAYGSVITLNGGRPR